MRATFVPLLLLATACGSLGIQPVKPLDTGGLDASDGDSPGDVNGGGSGSDGSAGDAGDGGEDGGDSGDETPEGVGITSLSPNEAGLDGGTTVVVSGHGFTGDVDFFFSSAEVAVTVLSDTELTVLSPLVSSEGTVDVTVVSDEGSFTLENAFTFTNNPGSGSSDGGGSGGSGSGGSGSGGSGSGGSGSGGSGSGGSTGGGGSSFTGTYINDLSDIFYGYTACHEVFNVSSSSAASCASCDFSFNMSFNYNAGASTSCGSSSFSAGLGFQGNYYGSGYGVAMLDYYGSWTPLSGTAYHNPSSGVFAWYNYYYYWGYGYLQYDYLVGYVR